jgi:hypothetical protein
MFWIPREEECQEYLKNEEEKFVRNFNIFIFFRGK